MTVFSTRFPTTAQIKGSMPETRKPGKLKRKTPTAGEEAASKKTKNGVSTLFDAFELVETQKRLNSLTKARKLLNQVRPFRPAVVVLSGKVKESLLDDEAEDNLSKEDRDTYMELSAAKHKPCCRGPAIGKYEKASKILAVAKPVMEKYPKPRKLSQVAPIVEIMLTFTGVIVDVDSGSFSMKDYDSFLHWLDRACSNIQWMSAILDPAFLLIRAADGTAAPAGAIAALNNIPVGAIGRSAELSQAPAALVPPGGRPTIPGLYQFADSDEAGIARACLVTWAASQMPAVQLDLMRFATSAAGMDWS